MTKPSPVLIRSYLKKWGRLENYTLQEKALGLLFSKFCPGNTKLEYVLLKVTALNQFYSTNIFDTFTVAKHILSMNIDRRLQNHDRLLVNELALVKIKGKKRSFYSFASKYCSHHVPTAFPIYDSFVVKMLLRYAREHHFASFTKADLKQYDSFIEIIKKFQKFYGLKKFTLRQIDVFLWLRGKKIFPRKYSI